MGDYGYNIIIAIFLIIYSLGFISVWTNHYGNFFTRFLIGELLLRKNNSILFIKKIKQITTYLYVYNVSALIVLFFLFPDVEPIITTGIALSIPFVRQYVERILVEKYGVEKKVPDKQKSKKNLRILIGVVILLIITDNPLSITVLGLTIYVLLALFLKFIVDFGRKRPYDTSPENKLKNHFDDDELT